MSIDPKDFTYIPIEEAQKPPKGLINHIKDHYWVVHPEKGVMFYTKNKAFSPQANSNPNIVNRYVYEGHVVMFIPSVFHRINPRDWVS